MYWMSWLFPSLKNELEEELEDKPRPQSKVLNALSRFYSNISLCWLFMILTSLPVQLLRNIHTWCGTIFTIWTALTMCPAVPAFLQTVLLVFRPKSSILVLSDQVIFFLVAWDLFRSFQQTQSEEWLQSIHSTNEAWLVERCWDGWPSGRYFHHHREPLEFCQDAH